MTTQVYRELLQAAALLSAFVQAHRHAQDKFSAHIKVGWGVGRDRSCRGVCSAPAVLGRVWEGKG